MKIVISVATMAKIISPFTIACFEVFVNLKIQ